MKDTVTEFGLVPGLRYPPLPAAENLDEREYRYHQRDYRLRPEVRFFMISRLEMLELTSLFAAIDN